ncbi:MAG TPA: hypothetical protein VFM14_03400 [Gemmatimonadales bacterium]|nr:hypothetical protein [Gemmatimonadales bacterium]
MDHDENEAYALLRHLDHPPPKITVESIAARARRQRASERWRWAAAVLLTTSLAGVAYAAPGSPLPGWLARAAERLSPRTVLPPAPENGPAAVQSVAPAGAGIAVIPGSKLLIVFAAPQSGGTARVTLTDGNEVTIRASTSAVDFTSERDRVRIESRGGAPDFEIAVPRAATRVEIRVADTRLFLKNGARTTAADSSALPGSWLLPLTSPSPSPSP